jgi:hypothetical protein
VFIRFLPSVLRRYGALGPSRIARPNRPEQIA